MSSFSSQNDEMQLDSIDIYRCLKTALSLFYINTVQKPDSVPNNYKLSLQLVILLAETRVN